MTQSALENRGLRVKYCSACHYKCCLGDFREGSGVCKLCEDNRTPRNPPRDVLGYCIDPGFEDICLHLPGDQELGFLKGSGVWD